MFKLLQAVQVYQYTPAGTCSYPIVGRNTWFDAGVWEDGNSWSDDLDPPDPPTGDVSFATAARDTWYDLGIWDDASNWSD